MDRLVLVSVHEMLSLDPNTRLADSSSATPVLKVVCPNLVRVDTSMRIRPELAESWIVSADARQFTFALRDNLYFHNGSQLDAEYVAWNFTRIRDSRAGSILGADFVGLETVKPLSKRDIQFTFSDPFPSFLYHLAGRCHICADTSMQPVGAGTFQVVDWVRGSHLTLRRFDKYWDSGKPKVDEIVVRWAPDAAKRLEMIEKGEVDLVEAVPATAAHSLAARGVLRSSAIASGKKLTLAFNCRRPPFNDRRVRLAVAHAVDRDALIAEVLGPYGTRVDVAYAPDDAWGIEVDPLPVDLDRAAQLMNEAGFSGVSPLKGIMTNVAPVPKVASTVRSALGQIGIQLDLRGYDDPPWWPLIYLDTDWDIAFQGMGPRAHPDILFRREFGTNGSFNATGYQNPELDEIIAAARTETAMARQKQLYDRAQHILRADMPVLILYATASLVGWRPHISGFGAHPLGYWDIETVHRV
jgi:peptide/nickel transport system substrate-binding protein